MENLQIQQGDVLLSLIEFIPKSAKKLNHLTLAEGELTGHHHTVECEDQKALLFSDNGNLYLDVLGDSVELKHQEHLSVTIHKGKYKVGIVQEYDYDKEESIMVKD